MGGGGQGRFNKAREIVSLVWGEKLSQKEIKNLLGWNVEGRSGREWHLDQKMITRKVKGCIYGEIVHVPKSQASFISHVTKGAITNE